MTDSITIPRWVAGHLERHRFIFDAAAGPALDELARAAGRRPQWEHFAAVIAELVDPHAPEKISAGLDQIQAYAAETLGLFGVDVYDNRVLFEVIATLVLVHQSAINSHESGAFNDDETAAVRAVVRTLGAALGRLAPQATP